MVSDNFLKILGAWQRGWRESQKDRHALSKELISIADEVDDEFKTVDTDCYRKRFLHKGELVNIFMADEKDEGVTSWTTLPKFAERFKGMSKENAVTAAIFKTTPHHKNVILNINSLWESEDFIESVKKYHNARKENSDALMHFQSTQGEVIFSSPLKASEIIAFSGISSPFDEICDSAGIEESSRDEIFTKLINEDVYCGELRYLSESGAQNVVGRVIAQMLERIKGYT